MFRCQSGMSRRKPLTLQITVGSILSAFIWTSAAFACGGFLDAACNLGNGGLSPGNIAKQTQQAGQDTANAVAKAGQDTANTVAKAGQDVANAINELQASVLSGPTLEQAIKSSHDTAINGAMPIPPQMRQQLTGYASEASMNGVRYKIGDSGFVNLARLLEQGGVASAVTLIDVIIFRGPTEAANPSIWAHELTHVDQYRDWGVHSFAVQYARNWHSVENPAYAKGDGFWTWQQQNQINRTVQTSRPGSSLQCAAAGQLRSIEGSSSTSINFVNQTSQSIRTYWLDYQGAPKYYRQLQPGERYSQQTYVSHPWMVTNLSGACLGVYMPDVAATDVVVN